MAMIMPALGQKATCLPERSESVRRQSWSLSFRLGLAFPSLISRVPKPVSPAASVGIEMSDVLTTVNGIPPPEKSSDFADIIASIAPGDTVYLRIRRNEQKSPQ